MAMITWHFIMNISKETRESLASYSASLLGIVIKHMREVVNGSRSDREGRRTAFGQKT